MTCSECIKFSKIHKESSYGICKQGRTAYAVQDDSSCQEYKPKVEVKNG